MGPVIMPISFETYKRVVLEDDDHIWELACGLLRRKPDMTTEHGQAGRTLATLIGRQIDQLTRLIEDLLEVDPVGERSLKGFHRAIMAYNVIRMKA